jgi:hypothetical protein
VVVPFLFAVAVAAAPRAAVIVVGPHDDLRGALHHALAADRSVQAQSKAFVDELLAGAAAADLVCDAADASCWTKVGLDGELDVLIVAARSAGGDVELRLVDVGSGREVRRTSTARAAWDARTALKDLLHPAPPQASPPTSPPMSPQAPPQASPQASPEAPPQTPPPPTTPPRDVAPVTTHVVSQGLPLLWIAAGGLGAIGATCGVAAAAMDVGLSEQLAAAKSGVALDLVAYRRDESTQNVLIGCGVVAGVAAATTALVAVMTDAP